MNESVLECRNISLSIQNSSQDESAKNILNDISFRVKKNSIFGIVGESGSGKTTLGKIICGLHKPSSGELTFNFHENSHNYSKIQLLFQNSVEIVNPNRKVISILQEALKLFNKKDFENRLENLLKTLGLNNEILEKYCYQLSGGERQRVALGRILAIEPELLILDEPFSAQDVESQSNLYKLLLRLKEKSEITIICISHNILIMKKIADDILVMQNGKVVELGECRKIFSSPEKSFTSFLIKAAKMELGCAEI